MWPFKKRFNAMKHPLNKPVPLSKSELEELSHNKLCSTMDTFVRRFRKEKVKEAIDYLILISGELIPNDENDPLNDMAYYNEKQLTREVKIELGNICVLIRKTFYYEHGACDSTMVIVNGSKMIFSATHNVNDFFIPGYYVDYIINECDKVTVEQIKIEEQKITTKEKHEARLIVTCLSNDAAKKQPTYEMHCGD